MPTRHSSRGPVRPCPAARPVARLTLSALVAGLAMVVLDTRPAAATEWTTAPASAVARLPAPTRTSGVSGGELRCAERRWNLLLSLTPEIAGDLALVPGSDTAVLVIGTQTFEARASAVAGGVSIPVAGGLLEPLKAGSRLAIDIAGATSPLSAQFSLRGSRRAIDAADPECSPRDMSAYEPVLLSEESTAVPVARALRAAEIAIFRKATASEPRISAQTIFLGEGRALLFAEICGSSWYYGRSGCNLTSFAVEHADADWRLVYDAEGSEIHLDRQRGAEGWPNLVTLPRQGGGDELVWSWSNGQYVLFEPDEADDPAEVPSEEKPIGQQ